MAAVTASVIAVAVMTTLVVTTSAMCVSVIAFCVMPMQGGIGQCISDCCFSADHVSGDDIGDGYISDDSV